MSEEAYREYLSQLWQDIHHGRNQDWQVLLIIFTITVAATPILASEIWERGAILFLALVATIFGMAISLQHWEIYQDKIELVRFCEEELGLRVLHKAIPKNDLKVSSWISMLFGVVAAAYLVILYYIFSPMPTLQGLLSIAIFTIALSYLITQVKWRERLENRSKKINETLTKLRAPFRAWPPDPDVKVVKVDANASSKEISASKASPKMVYTEGDIEFIKDGKQEPHPGGGAVILPAKCETRVIVTKPFFELELRTHGLDKVLEHKVEMLAESKLLQKRLSEPEHNPLKLVVGEIRKGEEEWENDNWSESKVLIDKEDLIEISFANADTDQVFQRHINLWETYVSLSEISVKYRRSGQPATAPEEEKTSLRADGEFHLLTIPPGVCHKVQLGGFTLVVQQAFSSARIADDKRICA